MPELRLQQNEEPIGRLAISTDDPTQAAALLRKHDPNYQDLNEICDAKILAGFACLLSLFKMYEEVQAKSEPNRA